MHPREYPLLSENEELLVQQIALNNTENLDSVYKVNSQLIIQISYHLIKTANERRTNIQAITKNDKLSLIHVAAYYDSIECIQYLLDHGLDIELESMNNYTPLHYACLGGSVEAAAFLLGKGANINAIGGQVGSVHSMLFLCACSGSVEIMNMLFDHGAKINEETMHADNSPLQRALRTKNFDCLEVLLSRGFKPNVREGQKSPLMQAIAVQLYDAVGPLLDKGADPNYQNSTQQCALSIAMKKNSMEIFNLLISHGAKITFIEQNGRNAVHIAASIGNLEMLKAAVMLGADPLLLDEKRRPATFSALTAPPEKLIPTLEYLFDCGIDINAHGSSDPATILIELLTDSKRLNPTVIRFLLNRGASLDVKAMNGMTAYQLAMKFLNNELKAIFQEFHALQ